MSEAIAEPLGSPFEGLLGPAGGLLGPHEGPEKTPRKSRQMSGSAGDAAKPSLGDPEISGAPLGAF
eukprot:8084597-Pyramimonas_sp.AAC.1